VNILESIYSSINHNDYVFNIDTIRIEFSLQHKRKHLELLGVWHKLKKDDFKYNQINKRISNKELSSVYKLEDYNIYYYRKTDKNKNQTAIMIMFGLKQYHKAQPPRELISSIVDILTYKVDFKKYRDFEIDLCFDTPIAPNYDLITKEFNTRTVQSSRGVTCYINNPRLLMIRSVCIYDKASKNNLTAPLWRYEATIHIPNPRELHLPLDDFIDIIQKGMTK
jgi:hypothetical protein